MDSCHFLIATIIMAFMVSSSLSLTSTKLTLATPTISAAPALLPDPPLSPYTEITPEISPLLPSPGRAASSPVASSIPTISSDPSPPDPDLSGAVGPDTALAPSGLLPDSSAVSWNLARGLRVEAFAGFLACWLVLFFMI